MSATVGPQDSAPPTKAPARHRRPLVLGIVAAISIVITLLAYAGHVFRSLEEKTVDKRFDVRGSQGAPTDVAIVAIDDVTFNDLRNSGRPAQFPLPRCDHADVIDRIAAAHPKAIAVDIQFTERTDDVAKDGVPCDNKLVEAVARAGNVVLETTEVDDKGHTGIFGGDKVLRKVGARPGHAAVRSGSDGVIRQVTYDTEKLESVGLVAAEIASGRPIAPFGGRRWIDYAGAPGTVRIYSYSRVMDGKVPASAFAGKVVVLGATAPSLQDLHATPMSGDDLMSGPEIQANIVESALHGFPLRNVGSAWEFALVVVFALIAPLAGLRLRGWRAPAVGLACGVVFVLVAQLAFDHGRVVPLVYPLLALVLSSVGVLVVETTGRRPAEGAA